jgi:hypothetical protein
MLGYFVIIRLCGALGVCSVDWAVTFEHAASHQTGPQYFCPGPT